MLLGAVVYVLSAKAADIHEAQTKSTRQTLGRETQLVERTLSSLEPERSIGVGEEESWLLHDGTATS